MTVPAGVHRVSLFFEDNDGHADRPRFRDYAVELKADAPDVAAAAPLARTRVSYFHAHSVYKGFVLSGGSYRFRIGRNYSDCTKIAGLLVDAWGDTTGGMSLPGSTGPAYARPAVAVGAGGSAADLSAAVDARPGTVAAGQEWPARVRAYRYAAARPGQVRLLKAWRWALPIRTRGGRGEFDRAVADAAAGRP